MNKRRGEMKVLPSSLVTVLFLVISTCYRCSGRNQLTWPALSFNKKQRIKGQQRLRNFKRGNQQDPSNAHDYTSRHAPNSSNSIGKPKRRQCEARGIIIQNICTVLQSLSITLAIGIILISVFYETQAHNWIKQSQLLRPSWKNVQAIQRSCIAVVLLLLTLDRLQLYKRQRLDATSEWVRYALYPAARGRALLFLMCFQVFPLYLLSCMLNFFKSFRPMRLWNQQVLTFSGQVLATGLLQLGPLYVKIGQILSCYSQENQVILPGPWTTALGRLQDQVPAKSGDAAWELASTAWPGGAAHFHDTFVDFDAVPMAAASLGQVHRAVLRSNNNTVAIKLQRPHLREIYNRDLALLKKIAVLMDRFGGKTGKIGGIQQSWTSIFQQAQTTLSREIDYRDEAANGMRFCHDFRLGMHGKPTRCAARCSQANGGGSLPSAASWLRAPLVYTDLCDEKVLVMEYVPSIKINNATALLDAKVTAADCEYLADCLARAYLRQFCCNHFFSTDPHPGNLGVEILDPNGKTPQTRVRLVFYDFGQAVRLDPSQGEGMLDVLEAIVDMNVDKSVKAFQKMGVLNDGADLGKVRAKVADNFQKGKVKANLKRLAKRNIKTKDHATMESSTVTTQKEVNGNATPLPNDAEIMQSFTLLAEYAFVSRALVQMHGVGKFLDADFDFISAAAPFIYEIKGLGSFLLGQVSKWWGKQNQRTMKQIACNHSTKRASTRADCRTAEIQAKVEPRVAASAAIVSNCGANQ